MLQLSWLAGLESRMYLFVCVSKRMNLYKLKQKIGSI